jgi:hypothetical protein
MVQGGHADADTVNGAGIHVADRAALNLNRAMVNGNHATGNGGGIYNLGQTVILRSTISHNKSDGDGGGIYNEGLLGLSMSTVSTNEAMGDGGGLGQSNTAETMVGNVTFNLNAATVGGAVDSQNGSLSMVNTILANSLSGGNCTPGPIVSGGSNLSSDSSCELETASDMADTDPMLTGLHSFLGKGLPVHMLMQSSPADGAGDSSVVDVEAGDQLDTVRAAIQIGAAGIFDDTLGVIGRLFLPTYSTSGPGGEVRVYNTVNHSLVATLPVPDVRAAAVNPYGSLLFLARGRYQDNTVPNELLVYALPSLNFLYSVPLLGVPNAVAPSGSSLMVYVVGSDFTTNAGYVTAINSGTATVSSSLTGLNVLPLNMDADLGSTSSLLFITGKVSGGGGEEILIYSTTTETLLPSTVVAGGSPSIAIAPGIGPSRMYVNGFAANIPMFAGWISSLVPLGSIPKTVSVGDIVVHPDGNRVYAGDISNVNAINAGAGVVTATIGVGGRSLAVHPSGWWVYAGEPFGEVNLINPNSNTVTSTLSVTSSHSISKMAVHP